MATDKYPSGTIGTKVGGGKKSLDVRAHRELSETGPKSSQPSQIVPAAEPAQAPAERAVIKLSENRTWDVRKVDGVLGVGRVLGQVVAVDRAAADVAAAEAFPAERQLLVCLALRTRRRSRSTLGDL